MGQQLTSAPADTQGDRETNPTAHLGDQPATVTVDDGDTCDHAVIGVYGGADEREDPIAEVTVYRDAVTRAVRVDVDTFDQTAPLPILRVDRRPAVATQPGAEPACGLFEYDLHGTIRSVTVSGHVDEEDDQTVVVRIEPEGAVAPPLRVWVGLDLVHNTSPEGAATDPQGDGTASGERGPAGGHWADHPVHLVADWQYEVANGDTRLGYADWCANRHDLDG